MSWATIEAPAAWTARIGQKIIRPAFFVYLDWPTGRVYASTHNKSVTTSNPSLSPTEQITWSGVGRFSLIEAPEYRRNGALLSYRIGFTGLPQGSITESTEAAAIGKRAIIYFGLANEAWSDWVIKTVFIGHIITAGDFRHRRDREGNWLTDATVEISNGRSPRRTLQNHHSPETAEAGDTAWRLLSTAGRARSWPTGD